MTRKPVSDRQLEIINLLADIKSLVTSLGEAIYEITPDERRMIRIAHRKAQVLLEKLNPNDPIFYQRYDDS